MTTRWPTDIITLEIWITYIGPFYLTFSLISILLFFCWKSVLGFSFRIYYCIYSFASFSLVQDESLIAVSSLAGYSFDAITTTAPSAGS